MPRTKTETASPVAKIIEDLAKAMEEARSRREQKEAEAEAERQEEKKTLNAIRALAPSHPLVTANGGKKKKSRSKSREDKLRHFSEPVVLEAYWATMKKLGTFTRPMLHREAQNNGLPPGTSDSNLGTIITKLREEEIIRYAGRYDRHAEAEREGRPKKAARWIDQFEIQDVEAGDEYMRHNREHFGRGKVNG